METENRTQQLSQEIDDLTDLIEKWQASHDPDTRWALYILEYCLDRRISELNQLQE